jgi:VIT1/CCC1 family predicted Fe2+/Mn2+ transporter
MSTLVQRVWRWYERHYLLNLSVATGLFMLQAFHLYWLFTDVILRRLTGQSYFAFPQEFWPIYVFIDYTEIPALITVSAVYLHSLGKRNSLQAWLALAALNIQWLHLFWITDEIVVQTLSGSPLVGLPPWLAWIAILIDYLEIPVMIDTVRRLINEISDLRMGSQVQLWKAHWQEEGDAAYVYRKLAGDERDRERARLYRQLAEVEDQHVDRWAMVLRDSGVKMGRHRPSLRVRLLSVAGRLIGWQLPSTILLAEERREMEGYLRAAGEYTVPAAIDAAKMLAKEAAEHAQQLSDLLGISSEPWHRTESVQVLQESIQSAATALVISLGLMMGLIGVRAPAAVLQVTGIFAMVVVACSLAATKYLSSKGERDRLARELAMEREELRLMPDLEERELALVYRSRGLDPEEARKTAKAIMRDPERALAEKLQMELGGAELPVPPMPAGWMTGISALLGAAVPVLPFLRVGGETAAWLSLALASLAGVAIGIIRSVLTGENALRSAAQTVVMAGGVALAAFLVGRWALPSL